MGKDFYACHIKLNVQYYSHVFTVVFFGIGTTYTKCFHFIPTKILLNMFRKIIVIHFDKFIIKMYIHSLFCFLKIAYTLMK